MKVCDGSFSLEGYEVFVDFRIQLDKHLHKWASYSTIAIAVSWWYVCWTNAFGMSAVMTSLPSLASISAVNRIDSTCAVELAVPSLSIQDLCLDPSTHVRAAMVPSLLSIRKMRLRIFFLFSSIDRVDVSGGLKTALS
jgi:hypothetical protein